MPLTIQKLHKRLRELESAAVGNTLAISDIWIAPASSPQEVVLPADASSWHKIQPGQVWGETHGTTWLRVSLKLPALSQEDELEYTLGLAWNRDADDHLLLKLEATVFLDGAGIGALDWRHLTLVLPPRAADGQKHVLSIQVYTREPLPFGGLSVSVRYGLLWRLAQKMQTQLAALQALGEHEPARHRLLEQLNTAYNMFDLREGWQSVRFRDSARAALSFLQSNQESEPGATGSKPTITVSGHAHLDVGWRWPYWRSRQKIAHTISTVLSLMERYPNFYYSQSQPQLLQWLKEDQPELYRRVQERVREGRFELVGAMWVEADCNLPSGESFIRQIMYGRRFWQEEFGITSTLIWLPDVFGYSAALPQIMRGCQISTFMTTKISWNQFNRMPNDTFRWRGIDGSEVLTHFITAPDEHANATYYTYNGPLHAEDLVKTWTNYRQQSLNDQLLYLCGWGDGGGGPTEEQLEQIQTLSQLPGTFPHVRMGRNDAFFHELYERVWEHPRLPTWVGELYLEYHRGTYTSQARIKQANRRAEFLLRESEWLHAWARLYGMSARQEELHHAWRKVLLNQFHDVLPGSSIREVYQDAETLHAEARALVSTIRDEALNILRAQLFGNTCADLLVNTLPWERRDPCALPLTSGGLPASTLEVQQTNDWDGNALLLLDGLTVPAYSVNVLDGLLTGNHEQISPACSGEVMSTGEVVLQNAYYLLVFAPDGEIARLYDKRAAREVLCSGQTGNRLIAYEDRPLNYDAWDIDLYYEEKAYPLRMLDTLQIVEHGPVRTTVEIQRRFLSSRITQRISLWRDSPRIDFATDIDWHEHQILLKTAFPVAINSTRATYEIQFGHVERPTHRNTSWDLARFEVCAHRWVDLSEGNYGVSLLNDSKYGHDIHDTILRLTLLKSAIEPDAQADQGQHRFTYSLLPHLGDWREGETVRRAYELNVPLYVASARFDSSHILHEHPGPASSTFLSTDCTHVVIETVKPAEDGEGLIVRLYEAHNQHGQGILCFTLPILRAQECNLLEEPERELTFLGQTLPFQIRPFEIKTIRLHLDC